LAGRPCRGAHQPVAPGLRFAVMAGIHEGQQGQGRVA
jgi:hypothetical protein